MLPADEYKALKEAHLARQNRPPIPEPVNHYKLSANDSSYQEPSSAWSDSTASEVDGFSPLTFKKLPSKRRPTQNEPSANSRHAGFSASSPNQSATGPNNPIHPNTEARFGGFDPAAYEAAQALGHGSSYGAEALLLDSSPSTRQSTRPGHTQGQSSTGSDVRTWACQQPQHSQLFHNSGDAENAELIDCLAFSEATQGISHDPSMPLNLGPEHAQYWASRQVALGKVSLQNRRSEISLSNEARIATKQVRTPQDQLPGQGYHSMNPTEVFFVPEQTKHLQHHGPVYESLCDRPQSATPPRKKKSVFKRFWKKIFCGWGGQSPSVQPGR